MSKDQQLSIFIVVSTIIISFVFYYLKSRPEKIPSKTRVYVLSFAKMLDDNRPESFAGKDNIWITVTSTDNSIINNRCKYRSSVSLPINTLTDEIIADKYKELMQGIKDSIVKNGLKK